MSKSLFIILLLLPALCVAQRVQRVKGSVADKESKTRLIGVTIEIADVTPTIGAVSDTNGKFVIENVPVGKHTVSISYLGYQSITLSDVLVTSAKEVMLPLELEESAVKMTDVVVTHKREHINEMALVSTRTFDVQETERYAGSRADPARMASNFAGVQGGDDSRNDIVIRGNSPQGVLWRLEGVDIPNPNHFSIPGTTGGPVSMVNSKTLANSDFFMGAFPAEYGDAIAGVFDLRLRNGNNDRYEFTGQLGFLGTELAAEGPISRRSGSSFLFTYRYSTLALFQGLHIKIGTTSIPKYQDATFKLNFPIGKKSDLSVFGIGGLSNIDLKVSDLKDQSTQLYGESDRDQYFTSNTGIVGASFNHTINPSTFTKITIAETGNDVYAHHDYIFRNPVTYSPDSLKNILGYDFTTTTTVAHWYVNKKISPKKTIKFGIVNNYYHMHFTDSSRQYPVSQQVWRHREDYIGSTDLVQAYLQYKYRPSDALTFTAGLHAQYLTHNQSKSIEPRVGMRWSLSANDIITAGYGLHSQMLSLYQYFAIDSTGKMLNHDIEFMQSHHIVLGYDKTLSKVIRVKLEAYYQYLFNVPVETRAGSSYTALDQGSGYSRDFPGQLQNTGTGYNYGLELTLEKKYSHGYYVLFSGSLFDSKAKGNDGVYRNTDYNSHYAVNILGGYEKRLGKYSTLITGVKVTCIGGKLYSPFDTVQSNIYNDAIVLDSQRNTLHFRPYFRADLKLGVRFNSKKVTHEIALDVVNIFNTKNILSATYSYGLVQPGKDPWFYQYQLGFLPIFYYRLDFGGKRHADVPSK
jgi:CarboxypepD_reg-like domain/TonB-dependent Receptor Plug Domain